MSLTFKHFDTRLNQWIHEDGDLNNPDSILAETLDNTLLEVYFPGVEFSFGHIDEKTQPEDLYDRLKGHRLLLSSKSRLLYGPAECLETIDKLCPDRKDRGAYGSIFLGSCHNALAQDMNILVVDDATGENGGVLPDEVAWRQVGDCHGKISPELCQELSGTVKHVIQHRLALPQAYRFAKGTLAPKDLSQLPYTAPDTPPVDLILPTSSFKGGDKENDPIRPGLHRCRVWIGEKARSQRGKIAISQAHASFPEGVRDFLKPLEDQVRKLQEIQTSHRQLAEYYCQKYEKRKEFQAQKASEPGDSEDLDPDTDPKNDLLMYRLIEADLKGHGQLLETQKVTDELNRFVQKEWRDIALGKTIEFERGMVIPSKDLKHGEICVPQFPEGEELLNFRSPLLNSNGMCLSVNKYVEDALAPNGNPLEGVIVVNDEDLSRIRARIDTLKAQGIEPDETVPRETESERQGRDYDGDCIGVERSSKYPTFAAEARRRNEPENAYAPVKKEAKVSFKNPDGTQPPFEDIAIFMSDAISVGVINNHATAVEALESEIDILKANGTPEQKANYVRQVGTHYQKLIQQENAPDRPTPIKAEYRDRIIQIAQIASSPLTPTAIDRAMSINRSIYHDMIGEAGYQNQLAVDIFKSNRAPDTNAIATNNRLLYRIPEYIRDKKSPGVYVRSGIKAAGFSPVELMIRQTNRLFNEAQLQARPTEQFYDLFPESYSPAQKMKALFAKGEFDKLFNNATAQSRKRQIESGPVLKVKTQKGVRLEISNVIKFDHPDLGKTDALNISLVENQRPNAKMPHKLIALAQVKGEVDRQGKPIYKRLGTVCEVSRRELRLTAGLSTNNAEVTLAAPLTEKQCRLLFQKAHEYARSFRESIPEEQMTAMAAATWHVCTSPENPKRGADGKTIKPDPTQRNYKISNFAFAAFPDEIIGQLDRLQFTELRATGISRGGNQLRDEVWMGGEEVNIEIRVRDDLPPDDLRYGKRLIFVEDPSLGEYREFGVADTKGGQLPVGTKAKATIHADMVATATLHADHPNISQPLKFGKVNDCELAGHLFRGEKVRVTLEQYQPPPVPVMKLDGKVIGELDSDSIAMLEEARKLRVGERLEVTLNTCGREGAGLHTLATTAEGDTIRANRQALSGDFKDYRFNGEKATIAIGFKQAKPGMAVKIDGKVAGLFTPNQKESKEALVQAGLFRTGASFNAAITSNVTTASVRIQPDRVEYPAALPKPLSSPSYQPEVVPASEQQKTADFLLAKLKQQPSLAFEYERSRETPTGEKENSTILGLAVDRSVAAPTEKWLISQSVRFERVAPDNPLVELETERGYTAFLMDKDSVPTPVIDAIKHQCGEPLDANINLAEGLSPYHQRLEAIPKLSPEIAAASDTAPPTRLPTLLSRENYEWETEAGDFAEKPTLRLTVDQNKSTQMAAWLSSEQSDRYEVQISGKPVKMVYELRMHGEPNPLPVSTTLEAMRGYGRTHTTRHFEPYKAYGFKEGDVALAVSGEKQVAFRVGKQYPITEEMIADPQYREQWAFQEKHSAEELDTFRGRSPVWGLYMEPLGDYVDGKIVPFASALAQDGTAPKGTASPLPTPSVQQQRVEIVASVVAKTLNLEGTHHHAGSKYTADWQARTGTLTLTPTGSSSPVMVAQYEGGGWRATEQCRLSEEETEFFGSLLPKIEQLAQQQARQAKANLNKLQLDRD